MVSRKSPYNLIRDAKALGMAPSLLVRRAREAWQAATDFDSPEGRAKEALLRDIQRTYRRQYRAHLQAQGPRHQEFVAEQIVEALREGKLEQSSRPLAIVRSLGAHASKKGTANSKEHLAEALGQAIESLGLLQQLIRQAHSLLDDIP